MLISHSKNSHKDRNIDINQNPLNFSQSTKHKYIYLFTVLPSADDKESLRIGRSDMNSPIFCLLS